MAESAVKFNNDFAIFPRAFFGKGEKSEFAVDGKRLNSSSLMLLSYINTENAKFGRLNELHYDDFMAECGLARSTVCTNLKGLRRSGILSADTKRSKYAIRPEFTPKSYIVIYSFLLTEELKLGGIEKRLTKNAALYLSEIIAFYLNPKNKGKYFDGGITRCAKTVNVPQTTAWGIIDELIRTKAIYSKRKKLDSANNIILEDGKGAHKKTTTVYLLNAKILRRCKKIEQERKSVKEVKSFFGQSNINEMNVNSVSEFRRSLRALSSEEIKELAQKRLDEQREKLRKDSEFVRIETERSTALKEYLKDLNEELYDSKCSVLNERQAEYLKAHNLPPNALDLNYYISQIKSQF